MGSNSFRGAEHVGAQFFGRHLSLRDLLDCAAMVSRHGTRAVLPLRDESGRDAESAGKLFLRADDLNSFGNGLVHAPTIAPPLFADNGSANRPDERR
jgi:hypothetical protein